ncbi:hypothetical protein [Pedobacter sp. UBA4863]|uniref:hypothetical protein n=1 Tax=Pedobacter sp. UBA4863 TaxID=1947060 RepID=UPI0025E6A709|nr:hypothetical protein [Pedobacter sp. UBA4863]
MKANRKLVRNSNVIETPIDAKEKFSVVAATLKGKELFVNKIAEARKSLKGLKSLPI